MQPYSAVIDWPPLYIKEGTKDMITQPLDYILHIYTNAMIA